MENLELGAIFTGSKFLHACMLKILMGSSDLHRQEAKPQFQGPGLYSGHLNMTPHIQLKWKKSR